MKLVKLNIALLATLLCAGLSNAWAQQPTPLLAQSAEASLAALKSPDSSLKAKVDACRQLAVLGGKDAIPVLAGLLRDEKLSHMARYALEPNPDPAVDEVFRQALRTLKGRPLVGVIVSIGVRKDQQAVEALARMLSHDEADVVQAAARSLGNIANPAAVDALKSAMGSASGVNQLAVCEGLFRCAENLYARQERARAVALYDELRKVETAHHIRTGALRGAILARGADGIALLREQLRNENYLLFAAAVRTTYEIQGRAATEALGERLSQLTDPDRQRLVILALGKRSDAAAVNALAAAAKSAAKPIRVAAIKALAETGNPAAASSLSDLLDAGDREVSQAALESYASLQGSQIDAAVKDMLGSSNNARRAAAIELVGRRRMSACLPDLMKAAGGSDAELRPLALSKVGELGSPDNVSAVLGLLPKLSSGDDLDAAEQALTALCAKGEKPEACAEPVAAALDAAQPKQKAVLLRVLGSVGGPRALRAVRAAVDNPNPEVHGAAIRTLGSWKTADAAPALLDLAKNASDATDRTLSLRGYLGLAANPDVPANERLTMCREASALVKDDEEKRLLLAALGTSNSARAARMVVPYLDEEGTKEEASAALAAIADRVLKGERSAQAAPRLVEPLEKAAKTASNEGLVKRLNSLLQQARAKGAQQ